MWTINDSLALYNIDKWGNGFFGINEQGNVVVMPERAADNQIDLKVMIEELQSRGIQLPILLRFSDILYERMREICNAFSRAIAEMQYTGRYQGVYPVKVNQVRQVVESIVNFGRDYRYGLECGSKPELLMVLGLPMHRKTHIICNGYKDAEFIDLALAARKLGTNITIVIEKFSELILILERAKKIAVHPGIGIRLRLSSKGIGKWAESGGDRSKFGLGPIEITGAMELLRENGLLSCLELIHYHIGSQVNSISTLKYGLREAGQYYVELKKMGAGLKSLDVGGGLAVDYDGSSSNRSFSTNYSIQEYANTVVYEIQNICEENAIDAPVIITEAGRALTAYHSVLITNILGVAEVPGKILPSPEDAGMPAQLQILKEANENITGENFREAYHDILDLRRQVLDMFNLGYLNLQWRALAESYYWVALKKIWHFASEMESIPSELARLEKKLADVYFCNISIFQSLPDTWAINHFFPTVPIQRMDEEPLHHGVLADVSCDSDGKIDLFIDETGTRPTLPLHAFEDGQDYWLGFFLVGAYQEILGDLHNLFGDTNAVHISWDEKLQAYAIEHVVDGDSVRDVLRYVHFNDESLVSDFRKKIESALHEKRITMPEARFILEIYRQGIDGYTYLENDS